MAFAATKDDLKSDVNKLRSLAQSEIAKLESESKVFLAHEIEVIEKEISQAEETLKNVNPQTELGKIGLNALETIIKTLSKTLHSKINSQKGVFYESTKEQLVAEAKVMKQKAEEAIKKLKQEGKVEKAHAIEIIEKDIIVVEKYYF